MSRRIRPKTRPGGSRAETPNGESQKGRIKIRMRRESFDPMEAVVSAAKKEAAKEANFRGFKSGKKAGVKEQVKKTQKVERKLERAGKDLERETARIAKLEGCLRTVEKALSTIVHTVTDNNFDTRLLLNLDNNGVRMHESGVDLAMAAHKWTFAWPGKDSPIVRDQDGIDRVASTMQRHRLHPGHRIPIREMWPIWEAVSRTERLDIDPMQGMRGTWYWNTRRYSTHSAAMNAWRRHMHQQQDQQNERDALATLIPEPEEESADVYDVDEDTPAQLMTDAMDQERSRRNMRNRVNGLLRSCEQQSTRWWLQHYLHNQERIENICGDNLLLPPFLRVCANFAKDFADWDRDDWAAFRQDLNYYMEVQQNGGALAAGTPSTRRRRGRRSVTRDDSRTRSSGGYNRSNY